MSVNIDPEEIFTRLESVGHVWVEKNAIANLLEDTYKSELNTTIQDYLKIDPKLSMAAATSKALAHQTTFDKLYEKCKARREADEAKVSYDAAKCWFDALRTVASTRRQEMKMLGSTT